MKICLYGAGSNNIKSKYIKESYKLGEEIAKRGHSLVFGGGSTGVMGAVSKGVLDNDGKVLGIAPEWMEEFEGICRDFEIIVLKKLNRHNKKIVIFNMYNFYDPMLEMIDFMIDEGVIRAKRDKNTFKIASSILLEKE